MNLIKKYSITLGIMLSIITFFLFFFVLLNYYDLINQHVLAIFKIILMVTSFFIGGLITGKHSLKKGWFEGFKIGSLGILLFIIINSFFFHEFYLKYFLYYMILIGSSILGSIIGINKKQA